MPSPAPGSFRHVGRQLLLLSALAVLLVTACGDEGRDETPAADYSGAFARWLFGTLTLSQDVDALGAAIAAAQGDEAAELAGELELLASRQLLYNEFLREAVPPAEWRQKHAEVTQALDAFDLSTNRFLSIDPAQVRQLAEQLITERRQLVTGVITCYSESPACRESLA
jgi:hypothetical protein